MPMHFFKFSSPRFGSALNFCSAHQIVEIFAFSPAACHSIAMHLLAIVLEQSSRGYLVDCPNNVASWVLPSHKHSWRFGVSKNKLTLQYPESDLKS